MYCAKFIIYYLGMGEAKNKNAILSVKGLIVIAVIKGNKPVVWSSACYGGHAFAILQKIFSPQLVMIIYAQQFLPFVSHLQAIIYDVTNAMGVQHLFQYDGLSIMLLGSSLFACSTKTLNFPVSVISCKIILFMMQISNRYNSLLTAIVSTY